MTTKRHPLIAGNWKMNGLKKDVRSLAGGLASRMKKLNNPTFEMLLCPPAPLVGLVSEVVKGSGIAVGGQDCHDREAGAHTGDISAALLKSMGCKYVIVGHSERRTDHAETDKVVKAKAETALVAGLKVIVCIGETLKERKAGQTLNVNRKQLRGSLSADATAANTVIAYEPVWAIGTGKTATPAQAEGVHRFIRGRLGERDGDLAERTPVLYGGSVKGENAAGLFAGPNVDGGLIGGAALDAQEFLTICRAAADSA